MRLLYFLFVFAVIRNVFAVPIPSGQGDVNQNRSHPAGHGPQCHCFRCFGQRPSSRSTNLKVHCPGCGAELIQGYSIPQHENTKFHKEGVRKREFPKLHVLADQASLQEPMPPHAPGVDLLLKAAEHQSQRRPA